MTMIRYLEQVDMTTPGELTAIELGETPFFPGGNAMLWLDAVPGGAGELVVEGAATDSATPGDWTPLATITAASPQMVFEITPLPKWLRLNVEVAGTGTINAQLEGVQ